MDFVTNMIRVIELVVQMFLLMGVGVLCGKCKWMNAEGASQMTGILLKVVTFCVIVGSFVTVEYSAEKLRYLLTAASACLVCTFLAYFLFFPFFRKQDAKRRSVLHFGVVFSNCGFMSLPLVSALFGAEGVFVVSMYVAVFQILSWTLGVKIYGQFDSKKALRQILLNPGVISVAAGLPLFFLGVNLPNLILSPMNMLADLNTPVAMVITGFYLSKMTLQIQKGDFALLMASLMRLLLVPAIMLGLMYALQIRGFLLAACIVPICAPSASNTSLFAVMCGSDQIYASRMVSICTLLSVLTMPLLIALAQITG